MKAPRRFIALTWAALGTVAFGGVFDTVFRDGGVLQGLQRAGLDILSDRPESAALLDGIVRWLSK